MAHCQQKWFHKDVLLDLLEKHVYCCCLCYQICQTENKDKDVSFANTPEDTHEPDSGSLFPTRKTTFKKDTALQWKSKLPQIILTNARSLKYKMDNLDCLLKQDSAFKSSDLICITETWEKEDSPSTQDGKKISSARKPAQTKKKIGGGLLVLHKETVNLKKIGERQNHKYQSVVLRYKIKKSEEKQNVPPLILFLVYVQSSITGKEKVEARKEILKDYNDARQWSNGGPILLLGDFNWMAKEDDLAGLHQYVTCLTTETETLDKCYGNVPDAYTSQCKIPLYSSHYDTYSDHNVIVLTPVCKHTETTKFWER